jgi:hypothetical protein
VHTGGANDGLVAATSARWGTFVPDLWEADHAEEVGYDLDNLLSPPDFPYLAKDDALLDKVARLH